MTRRKYYTDPIAAAWMHKHHGMRFQDEVITEKTSLPRDFKGIMGMYCDREGQYVEPDPVNLYVHPESEAILEPRVGDVVKNCDERTATVIKNGLRDYNCVPLSEAQQHVGTEAEIIQRNGIAFMTPEKEA